MAISMATSGSDLSVPTIDFWPIFQVYVRGYTAKIWYYRTSILDPEIPIDIYIYIYIRYHTPG
jgi:hypothetical protein